MPPPRSRAIVLRRSDPPSSMALAAELRLGQLLREVEALDAEVTALAEALAAFERRYRDATDAAYAALDRAERLDRRLRRLDDELARLRERLRLGPPPPQKRVVARGLRPASARKVAAAAAAAASARRPELPREDPPPAAPSRGPAPDPELKALYRRLARLLHPDLAQGDEAERARFSDLMARVNHAYARRDRAALELLAERIGGGQAPGDLSDAERRQNLDGRIASLEAMRARLLERREQLGASSTAQLRAEADARAEAGGDLLAEAAAGAEERTRALLGGLGPLLDRLATDAIAVAGARRRALAAEGGPEKGRRRKRSAWDPVAESPLLRRSPRAADRRLSPASRALVRALQIAAARAPWEIALTFLAFLNEEAGPPPETLASWAGLEERWEALAAGWTDAPELGQALAEAPRHLEIGLRLHGDGPGELHAGLQLAAPEHLAAARAAFTHEAAAPLARAVMAVLGPAERCRSCRADVYAVHLLRLRGIDEVHGLACPACATVLRSFWRYGQAEGLEALSELALEVELVAEQTVWLGGAELAFQMLPAERDRLDAAGLLQRFRDLCLEPYDVRLPAGSLALRAGRAKLAPDAPVPRRGKVTLVALPGAGVSERELLSTLRERIRKRFRG
jgi:hypothetical protein